MRTITAIAAKNLGKFLAKDFRQIFGSAQEDRAERLSSLARSTMECLGRTDALYHNLEHTMLVTLVGYDIMKDPRAALDPVGDWHISVVRLECTPRGALQLMSAQCPLLRQDRM